MAGNAQLQQSVQQLTAAMSDLGTLIPAYIAQRDAIDADLRQQLTDATAGDPAIQAAVDAAVTSAEQDKAALTPPTVPVPPAPVDTTTPPPSDTTPPAAA